jgi:hypothetical protein
MGARIRVSASASVSVPRYPTLPPIPNLGIDNEITCADAPACLLLLPVGARMIYARSRAASNPRIVL